jgi:flagellar biosynthetic protein FliR
MTLTLGADWLCAVLLCAMRLGALLAMTPLLDGFTLPTRIKLPLLLGLAAALTSGLDLQWHAPATLAELVLAGVAEVANGALLAFGILTAFSAVAFAGKALDIQIGFGVGNVYDPISRTQSPLIGSILGMLAVLVFFLSNAHHALLRAMAYMLTKVPLGNAMTAPSAELLIHQFGTVFTLGLLFGAPVVFCLFLLELGLSVLSRVLPQLNIFVVGLPVKLAAGLLALAVVAPRLGATFDRIFTSIFQFWDAAL